MMDDGETRMQSDDSREVLEQMLDLQAKKIHVLEQQIEVYSKACQEHVERLDTAAKVMRTGVATIKRLQEERNTASEEAEFFKALANSMGGDVTPE